MRPQDNPLSRILDAWQGGTADLDAGGEGKPRSGSKYTIEGPAELVARANAGQAAAIRQYERAVSRLDRAAAELETGGPISSSSQDAIRTVREVIGWVSPTPEQLRSLSQAYSRSLVPLRGDRSQGYRAYILSRDDFIKEITRRRPGRPPAKNAFMAAQLAPGREAWINGDHPALSDPIATRRAIGHEGIHSGTGARDPLTSSPSGLIPAYRWAGPEPRASFDAIRAKAPDVAASSPDHLVLLAERL